jgi:hypothetical protein
MLAWHINNMFCIIASHMLIFRHQVAKFNGSADEKTAPGLPEAVGVSSFNG